MKYFHKTLFCGSLGMSLSMGRNASRGKGAYSWISSDPAKAGPILGGIAAVVVEKGKLHN